LGHNFLSDWTQAEKDVISGKAARNHEKIAPIEPEYSRTLESNAGYPDNWTWDNSFNLGAVQNQ